MMFITVMLLKHIEADDIFSTSALTNIVNLQFAQIQAGLYYEKQRKTTLLIKI